MANAALKRGIASVSLSGGLVDKLHAAAAAGFDVVELFEPDLLGSHCRPESLRALAGELGIEIEVYQPLRDFEGVAESALKRNLARAEQKFDVMERLGATTLLVCSNVSNDAIDDDVLAAEQLARLAEAAARRGFKVAYEALAWGARVNDYVHSWRIVELAAHPALGVCVDSFHILSARTELESLARIPLERIFLVQLADAPRLPMAPLQWSRHHRCFPGQGELDVAGVVRSLTGSGYRGLVSLEVFNDTFRQVPSRRAAVDGMRSLLMLEESLGLTALAPAPDVRGFSFAEVTVDPATKGLAEPTLSALGFGMAGQHRSKPVRLWEQRGARVLVNDGPARLAALAVESSDPGLAARRAIELKAPERSRIVGPDEVDMTEVAAPDGTSVFFCRSDGGPQSWLRDFVLAQATHDHDGLLRAIDHVGLVQPFGHFDEAVLFWRSVLGLEFAEGPEFAAPDGLLRGRALRNPHAAVLFTLTAPLLGQGEITPAEVQHVAFQSDDAFGSADSLLRSAAPLRIPDNYYEELAARFDITDELLDAMRARSMLYDRDSAGGEFFHFYTEPIGLICFEVLERRGGYSGLGAVNAPIRLAAQAAASDCS